MNKTHPATTTETETVPWTDASGNLLGDDDDVFAEYTDEELAEIQRKAKASRLARGFTW